MSRSTVRFCLPLLGALVGLIGCGGGDAPRTTFGHVPPEPIIRGDVPGQGNLISYQSVDTMTADELTAFMKTTLGSSLGDPRFGTLPDAVDGMDYYCYMYSSIDYNGALTTLSGAVALPTNGSPKGLIIYTHGTAVGQNACPSIGITGPDAFPEAAVAVSAYTSGGYAVVLPDYIGQGSSLAAHPYVMPARNAPAGRDAAIAALAIAAQLNRPIGPNLYITGYSEGGANAMGLTQLMEQAPIPGLTLVTSAPMSGPYDLSGAQREMLMGPQQPSPEDLQFAPLLLTGDLVNSANAYFGVKPGDVFKAAFAAQIPSAFGGKKTAKQALEALTLAATLSGYRKKSDGAYHLADIMKPAAASALTSGDPTYIINQILAANNTFDWSPTVPMYLVGLQQDTLVSFNNTISAMKAMRARGITNSQLNYHGINGPDLNHLTAVTGASILVRHYLDGGFEAVPVDSDPS
ncbi:MAG: hypothetical protein K1X67_02520 [Fimbriimonadaceae bacterium]|nr:hypothetical protein [Fimbriimonadaceae bacterium]